MTTPATAIKPNTGPRSIDPPLENSRMFQHYIYVSWGLMALALLLTVTMHLVPTLIAGFLVYELVHVLSRRLTYKQFTHTYAKLFTVALLTLAVLMLLGAGILGIVSVLNSDQGSLTILLQKLAEIVDSSRAILPAMITQHLPTDTHALRVELVLLLKTHAGDLQSFGKGAGLFTAHVLIGMILGAMLSLHKATNAHSQKPFVLALSKRVTLFSNAFRNVVFAQIKIAAINAFFTWLYLGVALPLAGTEFPFTKTVIVLTFLLGLIPVVGNLVSNTIIVTVSLGISFQLALISLAFLVIIHKFEYFLNAKIVGHQIKAHIWEILLAMLVMETLFGVAGVVVAPIFYAYLKEELVARNLI
jgi:predicted PurR-regulated permease PerM